MRLKRRFLLTFGRLLARVDLARYAAGSVAENRKTKGQPIPPDLAKVLSVDLASPPAGQPIWGGTWAKHYCGARRARS
jgi:hypothetical protein